MEELRNFDTTEEMDEIMDYETVEDEVETNVVDFNDYYPREVAIMEEENGVSGKAIGLVLGGAAVIGALGTLAYKKLKSKKAKAKKTKKKLMWVEVPVEETITEDEIVDVDVTETK